jgi:hypothetical protein
MSDDRADQNIGMDQANLWREETFTDRRVGTLQRLTPVTPDGDADSARAVVYVGQTQVLTPGGALPLSFEVEAASLSEAIDKFGDYAQAALENAMQRLEEMRREAASSLIVPGSGGPAGPRGGIQIP